MAPISATPEARTSSPSSDEDVATATLSTSMNLFTRTLFSVAHSQIYARDNDKKSFWDKYKWYIIGGLAALPPQILLGWWYLRRRKAKKARLARRASARGQLGGVTPQDSAFSRLSHSRSRRHSSHGRHSQHLFEPAQVVPAGRY